MTCRITISLRPPLIIENLLPCRIGFQVVHATHNSIVEEGTLARGHHTCVHSFTVWFFLIFFCILIVMLLYSCDFFFLSFTHSHFTLFALTPTHFTFLSLNWFCTHFTLSFHTVHVHILRSLYCILYTTPPHSYIILYTTNPNLHIILYTTNPYPQILFYAMYPYLRSIQNISPTIQRQPSESCFRHCPFGGVSME